MDSHFLFLVDERYLTVCKQRFQFIPPVCHHYVYITIAAVFRMRIPSGD